VDSQAEIRNLLTTGRATITPDPAGLPADGGHRRVSGRRREEAALLAGEHLTRAGLDLQTRDLLTVAMLVSMGGCEPQAKGMSPRTATSATPSPPSCCRSSAIPAALDAIGHIDEVIPTASRKESL
jgi:alkylhydroperoxidase/carboxymuconolactone decarboxylase family protein YurZ